MAKIIQVQNRLDSMHGGIRSRMPRGHNLIGKWSSESPDSRRIYEFLVSKNRIFLRVSDKTDGEAFLVEKLNWRRGWLYFDLVVPSADWRTKNRIRLLNDSQALCEVTYKEEWRSKSKLFEMPSRALKHKMACLFGEWQDKEKECPTTISILPSGRGVSVRVFNALEQK